MSEVTLYHRDGDETGPYLSARRMLSLKSAAARAGCLCFGLNVSGCGFRV